MFNHIEIRRNVASLGILASLAGFPANPVIAEHQPPQPSTTRYTDYERLTLMLPKAFRNERDVTLHVGVHDGRVLQVWGELKGVNRIIDHFDVNEMKAGKDRLAGELVMTVYVPVEEKIYRCRLKIDAKRSGSDITGQFTSCTAARGRELAFRRSQGILEPEDVDYYVYGEKCEGDVDVLAMKPASPDYPVQFSLYTVHVLRSQRSMDKYVELQFKYDKEQVTDARISSRGGDRWTGNVTSIHVDFDGADFRATVKATLAGGSLEAGDYSFQLKGTVRDNLVIGRVQSQLNGKTVSTNAGFGGEVIPINSRQPGEDFVYRFSMPTAREGRLPLYVYGSTAEDGRWRPGRAVTDLRLGRTMEADIAGVTIAKDRLCGDVYVVLTPEAHAIPGDKPMPTTYTLKAKRSTEGYRGQWTCEYGERIESCGELQATVAVAGDLAKRDAIEIDWPCWSGPNYNFTAESTGHQLVDSLADARLVWRSEKTPPGRCQTTRYGDGNIKNFLSRGGPAGGSASPVLVDGKVFLAYPRPAGDQYHETQLKQAMGDRGRVLGLLWKRKAEDVVLCLDAATGQTLWRTVFPDGLYRDHPIMGSSKIGIFSTNVAAADGRVFIRTTSGWTFALHADSGRVLWSSPDGAGIHRTVIGGVLVSSSPDLAAIDVRTGKTQWIIEDATSRTAMPVAWKSDGKAHIIVGNGEGEIRCIEPADGKVLWTITDSGINAETLTVSDDYLLANGQRQKKRPARLVCYRISRKGLEKAWDAGDDYPWKPNSHPPVICGHHVLLKTTVGGKGSRGDDFVVLDIASGKQVHRIPSNASGSNGQTYWMDGRLISQADASHSKTPLLYYDAEDPRRLRQVGDVWSTRHWNTSAYSPMFMTHALADGRIIIRGGRGLFCYDLRKGDM